MNLNFHLVDLPSEVSLPAAMQNAAMVALRGNRWNEAQMLALAEVIDWHDASPGPTNLLVNRCERALTVALRGCPRALTHRLSLMSPAIARLVSVEDLQDQLRA